MPSPRTSGSAPPRRGGCRGRTRAAPWARPRPGDVLAPCRCRGVRPCRRHRRRGRPGPRLLRRRLRAVPPALLSPGLVGVGPPPPALVHGPAPAGRARRYGLEPGPVVLGFFGGLAPLDIQAPRPRDEVAI